MGKTKKMYLYSNDKYGIKKIEIFDWDKLTSKIKINIKHYEMVSLKVEMKTVK